MGMLRQVVLLPLIVYLQLVEAWVYLDTPLMQMTQDMMVDLVVVLDIILDLT
jgi:hypothetical protein|tara:strand:- start:227 stop:382 length:156 start_codon:yes stop_codon:yes gene_type:complete